MIEVANVYLGWDSREGIAYHVLSDSIIRRSSIPVRICPVGNRTLPGGLWWREKGRHDSTEFSNARFIIPALQNYQGWALWADSDMVALGDLDELWSQRDERYAVQVVKHRHVPGEKQKFLGAEQSLYARKNWSSLMLINCGHPACRRLTPEYVNNAAGLDLHRFEWVPESEVGEIHGLWNVLVAQGHQHPEPVVAEDIKLLHFTLGGPWHGHQPDGSELWFTALRDLFGRGNPCANVATFPVDETKLAFSGSFTRFDP